MKHDMNISLHHGDLVFAITFDYSTDQGAVWTGECEEHGLQFDGTSHDAELIEDQLYDHLHNWQFENGK